MTHATPADLLARLAELGLEVETHRHRAVFTVAESAGVKDTLPGAHSKNLFLKDRKGRMFLVVAQDTTRIDLKHLHLKLGAAGRLSFGSPTCCARRWAWSRAPSPPSRPSTTGAETSRSSSTPD